MILYQAVVIGCYCATFFIYLVYIPVFIGGGTMFDARVFGNNCRLQMQEQGVDKKTFAESLGFTGSDVEKLLDGRLVLYKDDITDISKFFHLQEDDMLENKGDSMYKGVGFMHCMGDFKDSASKDLILDIFDQYCTLEECTE